MQEIENNNQYLAAMERFEEIFQAIVNTPEGDEADKLAMHIKQYEQEHFPIVKIS